MLVVTGVVELYHMDEAKNRIMNQRLGANEVNKQTLYQQLFPFVLSRSCVVDIRRVFVRLREARSDAKVR